MLRLLNGIRQRSSLAANAINVKVSGAIESDSSYVRQLQVEWANAKPFKQLPGPTRWQIWRGFLWGGEYEHMPFEDLMLRFRQKYGDTYLMPGLFGMPSNVVTFSVKNIEKIYRTEGAYPVRKGVDPLIHYREHRADGFFKDCLGLMSNGHQWAKNRHAVNPVLMQHRNSALYLEPMQRVNAQFIQRIRDIRDCRTLEVPGNFVDDINHLTFESVAVVALDRELGIIRHPEKAPEAQKLFKAIQVFMQSLYDLGIKPSAYKYISTPTYRRFSRAMDEMFDICFMYVNEALKRIESKSIEEGTSLSVLEQLVHIDRKLAVVMAMDMLMGGVDTSSSVLAGVLLNLSKHPEKQAKLRSEVLQKLPKLDQEFTFSDMKSLSYLRAFIKESLRIYPIFFGNMRSTGVDLVLDGYQIPQETNVIMNSNMLLKEEVYYPKATEFLPERWLRVPENDNDVASLVTKNSSPFLYIPFGFGPRMCAGKRIVDMELELTVANLVRNFIIEFNYSTENAFRCTFMNKPAIPLKFKFTDVKY